MRPIDADAMLESLEESVQELRAIIDSLFDDVDKTVAKAQLISFLECKMRTREASTITLDDLRPKGRWRGITTSCGEKAVCSECEFDIFVNEPGNGLRNIEDLHFCPNCGADMRGGGE